MNGSTANTAEAVSPEIYQLARDQYNYLRTEKHFIFMENAGGSQVPDIVADAVRDHFRESCAQLYAGYPLSSKSTQKVEEAHEVAKYMVNAHDVGEVVIGPSSSNLFFTLANCYRKILKPGDEIVLHEASHESNIGPWIELASQGVVIKWWKVDPKTGDSSLHDLKSVLSSKTKLVAVTHVSNLLGDILNLPAVVAEVHAVGAKLVVDGVAYAPHRSIDVKSWGVDWYTFSVYKVYGPHMAVLFGRREAFDELANAKAGPNWFFIDQHEIPYKYEVGSANHEGCSGLAALPKYFATLLGLPQDTLVSRELIERAFALMTRMEQPLQVPALSQAPSTGFDSV